MPPRWEWALVFLAFGVALALGFQNLGVPSLWHDELVHAYVGKSIAETGNPALPSGVPYFSGTTINVILAGAIRAWGMTEITLRAPSVLLSGVNVVLTFLLIRALLGTPTALLAAFMLAVCPWTVAWAREARFYSLQQTLYLATVLSFWALSESQCPRQAVRAGAFFAIAFALGILTSFHSILFLGGIGAFVVLMALYDGNARSHWVGLTAFIGASGLLALGGLALMMNALDREAVLDRGGLGGEMIDDARALRLYYTHWLRLNLSNGFFAVALFGFAAMLAREGRRGLFSALAFWAPIVILTFLIGYRRPRFMFFAFPFYVAATSYGIVVVAAWLRKPKPSWPSRAVATLLLLFAARLAWSSILLVGDTLETASGAHTTLARRHPQWKEPCAYVKEHRGDAAVLSTTYLPALYYVGHVDNWYPARDVWWEIDESGMNDLKHLEDLQGFVADHPRGYFLAEWWRFERNVAGMPWSDFSRDIDWVQANMRRIDEASSEDVTVYAWGPP